MSFFGTLALSLTRALMLRTWASSRMGSTFLVALATVLFSVAWAQVPDLVLDGSKYQVRMLYPNFTIHPKRTDGSVYEDQYIDMRVLNFDEGNVTYVDSLLTFRVEKEYNSDTLRQYATWSLHEGTTEFLDGTVSNVVRIITSSVVPNGGNITVIFEAFDRDGSIMFGTNTVNISSDRIKYSAYATNWNLASPERQLRIIVQSTYVTGEFTSQLPFFYQHDWTGPTRRIDVSWPPIDNLQVALSSDVWAVADGVVRNIVLSPNPIREPSMLVIQNEFVPKYAQATFGFVLPKFTNVVAWDPTLLATLFSEPTAPAATPTPASSKTVPIVAGSVVGGVVLITAALTLGFYFKGGRLELPRTKKAPSSL